MTANPKAVELEDKIARLILTALKKQEITPERAKEIASYILKTLREDMNDQELYQLIPKLDDLYTELAPVVLEELQRFEASVGAAVKNKVTELIRAGKVDSTLQLSQKYFKREVG